MPSCCAAPEKLPTSTARTKTVMSSKTLMSKHHLQKRRHRVKSSVVETTASIPINPSITRRYVSQCCCICPDSPSASSKELT